jgi:hypothetical protein
MKGARVKVLVLSSILLISVVVLVHAARLTIFYRW